MIVAGIILRNVENGTIIAGLKSSWAKEFRGMALAIIFLRSGLELELGVRSPCPPSHTLDLENLLKETAAEQRLGNPQHS